MHALFHCLIQRIIDKQNDKKEHILFQMHFLSLELVLLLFTNCLPLDSQFSSSSSSSAYYSKYRISLNRLSSILYHPIPASLISEHLIHPDLQWIIVQSSVQENRIQDCICVIVAIKKSRLLHITNWKEFCPSFQVLLPEFKFLQCENMHEEYDFDFSNIIPIPTSSPLFQPNFTSIDSTQYMILQTIQKKKVNQNSTLSKSLLIHKESDLWIQSIIPNKVTKKISENTTLLQITTSTTSGYHSILNVLVSTNQSYCIVLSLPKDVILDKDELQLIKRKYPTFPEYITSSTSSLVESPVDFGQPQLLFLFGNCSTPITYRIPIHMRYAFPHNVDDDNQHHHISIPPATLLIYDDVSPLFLPSYKQSRLLNNGCIIANQMDL